VQVREYTEADKQDVLALAPRLQEGVAPWRDPDAVVRAVTGWVSGSLDAFAAEDRAVFVAEVENGLAGFVTVGTQVHFAGDIDAYVGELVVHPNALRTGVGGALMVAAEDWARARGLERLSLETGAANVTARLFYASLGYADEEVRLSKAL
jgi:GNAT superfamily N-acetyltransferase